jgi:hypothetical protein
MIPPILEDPRGQEADFLAYQAERLERRGDLTGARELYRRAAPLDEAVAREVPFTMPRWRIILAKSAVCRWARAGDLQRAVSLADEFLSDPTPRCDEHPGLEKLAEEYRARLARDASNPLSSALDAPHPPR